MYKAEKDGQEILVRSGQTTLHYDYRCIADLQAMLKQQGDWVELGAADEQKPAKPNTVEAWGRSHDNPAGGWYGLKKGFRGRLGMYLPPLMEALGLAEVEHNPKNNRMRAILIAHSRPENRKPPPSGSGSMSTTKPQIRLPDVLARQEPVALLI